jgi:hypothetical protein
MRLCRVLDADSLQPMAGASVWMQPYAPIHPFWPPGDKGITDAKGEVWLSLPWDRDFWFYFSDVKAKGYSQVDGPSPPVPWPVGVWALFYMKRDTPKATASRATLPSDMVSKIDR